MRSFIVGAVLCLAGLVVSASPAAAQIYTYTTPYGGFSYTTSYPSTVVYPSVPVAPYPYVVRRPVVAPYGVVNPWYPGYYYNRPYWGTYNQYYWRY